MLKPHMEQFAAYNNWATSRLYDAATALSADQLTKPVGVFFGGILGTLNHIVTTDRIWLSRLTGVGTPPDRLDATLSDDLASLRGMAQREVDRLQALVLNMPEDAMGDFFDYKPLDGTPKKQRLREALAHLFNHQTHHRSQAATCFTLMGLEAPVLDLLYFQRG